jgi:hypothetical protein
MGLSNNGQRVLLASPIRPFGRKHGDAFSCGTNAAFQLTWAQDGFRAEDVMWHWGLDLIAANLRTPCTVLHYPSYSEFVREVKAGYDYVGISFNLCTLPKLRRMVSAVREHAPRTKIVLGGYGTVLPDHETEKLGDHVCRGEGIAYMQRLLGEKPLEFAHPCLAFDRRFLSLRIGERTGIIFSSVGCPNGCEFCVTSHYFNRRQVPFLPTGGAIFDTMAQIHSLDPGVTSFAIMDEDFLVDARRGRELLRRVRAEGCFFDIMVFSSVRSLSQFTPQEVAEMGISRIWIGFESLEADYPKLRGRPFYELVQDLKSYGVSVVTSMIIGYDYQDAGIIDDEFRVLLGARPTAVQVLLFSPCMGTPAWDRLEREGRLRGDVRSDYALHDGYTLLYEHPSLSRGELESLLRTLCLREYRALGPSVFRFLETLLTGYLNLRLSTNPLLRRRAESFRTRLRRALPLFAPGIVFAPNRQVRAAIVGLRRQIVDAVGAPRFGQRAAGALLLPFFLWSRFRFRHELAMQPATVRREYSHS